MAPSAPLPTARDATPPRSCPPDLKLFETPHSKPETQSEDYPTTCLKKKRKKITRDAAPRIRQVPVTYFLENILPRLHERIDLPTVIQRLTKNKTIKDGRFGFYPVDPAKMTDHETKVYASVGTIAKKLIQAARSKGMKPTLQFFCEGNITPISENRDWSSKPDMFSVQGSRKKKDVPKWPGLFVPGEFKKSEHDEKTYDDELKVVGNMDQILFDDATRRFAYGITIENTQMRIWFATRAYVLVSEHFNFITNCVTTGHIILSMAYAPLHQLGCDPTVQSNSEGTLDIQVFSGPTTSRKFRTQTLSANKLAETLNGPGTRVWTVREVLDGSDVASGPLYVLKDIWVEEDRQREGETIRSLSIARPSDKNHGRIIATFLPHVVCDGDVYVEGQPDSTAAMLRGAPFPPESAIYHIRSSKPKETTKPRRQACGGYETLAEQQYTSSLRETLPTSKPGNLVHYRIVYREVYRPLRLETNIYNIFFALCLACIPIQAIHEGGLVHRNLSTNSIVITSLPHILLIDLEDAKSTESTADPHASRITALNFLAVEVEAREYLFEEKITVDSFDDEDCDGEDCDDCSDGDYDEEGTDNDDERDIDDHAHRAEFLSGNLVDIDELEAPDTEEHKADPGCTEERHRPFRYNSLHDLESLWWISVYFLMKKQVTIGDTPCNPSDRATLDHWNNLLFGRRTKRRALFKSRKKFMQLCNAVVPALRPAMSVLGEIRQRLVEIYLEVEDSSQPTVEVNLAQFRLYSWLGDKFKHIAAMYKTSNIWLKPLGGIVEDTVVALPSHADAALADASNRSHDADPVAPIARTMQRNTSERKRVLRYDENEEKVLRSGKRVKIA